jgi:hypothetical protein
MARTAIQTNRTITKRHIAGENLRSDAHVSPHTLRFGTRFSSHTAPFREASKEGTL